MELFNKVLHFIYQKLTNPHHIKVGDIVRYKGIELRVMRINAVDNSAILSEWHSWECVPLRKLKLVKSIKSSDFKPGDMVKVNDVTYGEMDTYNFDWSYYTVTIIFITNNGFSTWWSRALTFSFPLTLAFIPFI